MKRILSLLLAAALFAGISAPADSVLLPGDGEVSSMI